MAAKGYGISTAKFDAFVGSLIDGLDDETAELVIDAMGLRFIDLVANPAAEGVTTPVDTGRARAGWAAFADAQGHPVDLGGTNEGVAKGRSEGDYVLDQRRDGESRYLGIHNGVPYIAWLEYGSSDQAPGGFVRIALRRMRTGIRGKALEAVRDSMAKANSAARARGLVFRAV